MQNFRDGQVYLTRSSDVGFSRTSELAPTHTRHPTFGFIPDTVVLPEVKYRTSRRSFNQALGTDLSQIKTQLSFFASRELDKEGRRRRPCEKRRSPRRTQNLHSQPRKNAKASPYVVSDHCRTRNFRSHGQNGAEGR